MSSISVKWRGVDSAISMYSQQRQELSSIMASVRSVKSYRCMRGGEFSSVYSALDRVITRLTDEKDDIKSLEAGMTDILKAYENCEKQIIGDIEAGRADGKKGVAEWIREFTDAVTRLGEDIWKIKDLIGDAVIAIGDVVTQWVDEDTLTPWNDASTIIGEAVKVIPKSPVAAKWAGKLASKLGTSTEGLVAGTGKLMSAAGWILTGATNLIENYRELKDGEIGVGRMAAETLIETGVDMLVLAAATYVAAHVGVAAVAVGVAAVAITWAANWGCKMVTGKGDVSKGKDIGEVMADAVCDHPIATLATLAASAVAPVNPIAIPIGILATKWLGIGIL